MPASPTSTKAGAFPGSEATRMSLKFACVITKGRDEENVAYWPNWRSSDVRFSAAVGAERTSSAGRLMSTPPRELELPIPSFSGPTDIPMRLGSVAERICAFDPRYQNAQAHQFEQFLGGRGQDPAIREKITHAHAGHHLRTAMRQHRISNGGGVPEALPKLTSVPNPSKQSSDGRKVSLPTPSNTAETPSGYRRFTSLTKSTSRYNIVWSQPADRAASAFSALPTVPITVAPRCLDHWVRKLLTPPAAA